MKLTDTLIIRFYLEILTAIIGSLDRLQQPVAYLKIIHNEKNQLKFFYLLLMAKRKI